MWLWRLVHAMRVNFPFLLMGVLMLEGFLAVPLMFTFPPAALGLVFVGLATLALSIIVKAMLTMIEQALATLLGIESPAGDSEQTSAQ
tara:strand:+ start:861 stop:1124 length:264 start_codon:yes stop_codon:yes gene_type:complete